MKNLQTLNVLPILGEFVEFCSWWRQKQICEWSDFVTEMWLFFFVLFPALATLFIRISKFVKVVLETWSSVCWRSFVCPRWFRNAPKIKMNCYQYLHILSLKLVMGEFQGSKQTPSDSFLSSGGSTSLRLLLTGPDMAYLGSRVTFWCTAIDSSPPVTYELIGDGGVLIGTDIDLEGDRGARFVLKVTATSEGSYHCTAAAGGSTGVSNSIKLTVVSE